MNRIRRADASGPLTAPELTAAFEGRFRRPLMSYFLRRVQNHADAEDLTQQVFLRLLAASGSLAGSIAHSEGLVFTVAANLLKDRARRERRAILPPAGEPSWGLVSEVAAEASEERSPERVAAARESLADTLTALMSLGEKTHDIFILHRLENMKHREIADLFGLSVSSVEKHVIKATLFLTRRREHLGL